MLTAFADALNELLSVRAFEEITASEICELAGYPRATFYNYFDDKYDLLHLFWKMISPTVSRVDGSSTVSEALDLYFDRSYDLLERNEQHLHRILEHNPRDGYFLASCRIYLSGEIKRLLDLLPNGEHPVPSEIMAEHCVNTILLVLGKRFERGSTMTRADTRAYLEYLLGGF